MTGWWEELSLREKRLIAVMLAMLLLAVVVLAIIRPAFGFRSQAAQRLEAARMTHEMVLGAPAEAGGSFIEGTSLRAAVTAAARENNIRLLTIRLDDTGRAMFVSTEGTSWTAVAAWLGDLESDYGIRVREGSLRRGSGGAGLTVQVTLQSGS